MLTNYGAWALAIVLAAPVAAGARTSHPDDHDAQDRKGDQQTVEAPVQVRSFNVGANGSLKLANVAGDVKVTGGAGTEIKVEARIHGKGKTEADARAQFDSVKVDMRQNGNRVDVETTHQRNSRAWVDYTVVVPNGASIDVRTVSGDVFVSDVAGSARAETVSGDVVATGLGQVAALRSVSGDVQGTGLSSDGAVTFNSVSGDITIKNLKAKSATFETVSGTARVDTCDCGGAQSSSVSGDVVYTGTLVKGGRYVFTSHSGDISLMTSSGFELDAATFSGDIRVDGLTGQGDTDRPGPGRTRRGTVGGGGAVVEAKTFSGDLRVNRPR
ncbi:MAG: DUF4097 family beta strand repeat-containing protein [Vicinamibacteraceae bacterium]